MRVLAIDTALDCCAAAVIDTAIDETIAMESLNMARGHAEALMPLIARVMAAARMPFAEIDRVAVTTGPEALQDCASASRPRAASRSPPISLSSASRPCLRLRRRK